MRIEELLATKEAVNNSIYYIDQILDHLDKARVLGTCDIAGGMIAVSSAKYKELDKANENVDFFGEWFAILTKSPKHSEIEDKLYVEISDSIRTIDIFLDNLPVDAIVQGKIISAYNEAESVSAKLVQIKNKVETLINQN